MNPREESHAATCRHGVESGLYCNKCGREIVSGPKISEDPTQRVEATPTGAKGWEDQAGSAQVLAGGHGLDVAPDAPPEGVRAETRRWNDGAGDEPSNVPDAAQVYRIRHVPTGTLLPALDPDTEQERSVPLTFETRGAAEAFLARIGVPLSDCEVMEVDDDGIR